MFVVMARARAYSRSSALWFDFYFFFGRQTAAERETGKRRIFAQNGVTFNKSNTQRDTTEAV